MNLAAALIDTDRLLSATEIQAKVAGYSENKVAFRRTFARDKDDLREMGIPLTMGTTAGSDPAVEGYRIRKKDYYLPDLGLTPAEQVALHIATRAVRLEGTSADAALWALGGAPAAAGDGSLHELAVVPSDGKLGILFGAIAARRVVSFDYRVEGRAPQRRSVEPLNLRFARGHWYLSAYDCDREALRHFRLDRMGEPETGRARSFTPRAIPEEDLARPPWEIGQAAGTAQIIADAEIADWVLAQTGAGLRHERRPDGSLWVEVSVANTTALMDFVLSLLDRGELEGPPELRAELLAWLRAVADAPDSGPEPVPGVAPDSTPGAADGEPAEPSGPAGGGGDGGGGEVRRSLTSVERMQRLLQIIPWVSEQDGARLDDLAARFDYPATELVDDLQQVVFMVGVPPYTPGDLIEVQVDEGWVYIFFADYFRRPLRLDPPQAVAMLVAAKSLLSVAPNEPLASGLAKLAAGLGVDPDEALDVTLGSATEEVLATLQEACRDRRPVEIQYYSFNRDAVGGRVIEPYRTYADDGAWYVRGYCRLAADERTFRLDRVSSAVLLEETFAAPARPVPAVVWEPQPDQAWIELLLEPDAQWVLNYYPPAEIRWEQERCVVRMVVGGVAWLERLLLRLGPGAVVLRSRGLPPDPGRTAARRILARYGE